MPTGTDKSDKADYPRWQLALDRLRFLSQSQPNLSSLNQGHTLSGKYRTEFLQLAKLALPLVMAQLAQNSMSFIDTLMVGSLGKSDLAGIALGSTLFHFVLMIGLGIILAVNPTVSQATGANDEPTCGRALRQGLWLGLILFFPAFYVLWNSYPILIWLHQSEDSALASSQYLRAISWGLLPSLWMVAMRGYLEGKSNARPIMLICFAGVALNIFFNNALMFGKYGLPALGLVGTGYASSIVFLCMFLMMLIYVLSTYHAGLLKEVWKPDVSMLRELIRIGAPISATIAFEGSLFHATAVLMGTIGEDQLSAHAIALSTASIAFMIPLGLAIATSVRVGNAIGAGSVEKAEIAGRAGMIACVCTMCITGLLMFLFPKSIVGAFLDLTDPVNENVIKFAVWFVLIAALFQVFDGLQVAANLSLRGLKDTIASMVITLVSFWCVGAVAGWLLCYQAGLGGAGLWWGMTAGLATAALLLTWRFQLRINQMRKENLGRVGQGDETVKA